jgi:hypothetical protein
MTYANVFRTGSLSTKAACPPAQIALHRIHSVQSLPFCYL